MSKKRKATAKKPKKPKKPASGRVRATGPKARPPKRPSSRPARSPGSTARHGNSRGGELATFEEAKSAAVDALIWVIEESERRLLAVKRAGTYGELKKLTKGPVA